MIHCVNSAIIHTTNRQQANTSSSSVSMSNVLRKHDAVHVALTSGVEGNSFYI